MYDEPYSIFSSRFQPKYGISIHNQTHTQPRFIHFLLFRRDQVWKWSQVSKNVVCRQSQEHMQLLTDGPKLKNVVPMMQHNEKIN